ncbi:MAG: hypothetical protein HY461_00930 [Parcubacteria group bacterium]|nr:hypothetical protein [Parcubacteria group bacterium]
MLKILAKIHRGFARLPLGWRVVGVVLLMILVVAAIFVPLAKALNRRVFPFFDPNQTYFVDLRPTAGLAAHQETLASALSQISSIPGDELRIVLGALLASEPSRLGSYQQDGQTVFYARNPLQAVAVPSTAQPWQVKEMRFGRDRYVFLSAGGEIVAITPRLSTLWPKLGLYRLAEQDRGVLYAHPAPASPAVYGVFDDLSTAWQVRFAASPWALSEQVKTVTLPAAPFVLRHEASLDIDGLLPWPAAVQTWLNGPLKPLLTLSGSVVVRAGTFAQWSANPFADTLVWESETLADTATATTIMQGVLKELMDRYPMALERVLPDKTKVYELKQGAEFFLPSGQTIDLAAHPQGVMTFPHDQIRYNFDGKNLYVQKGEVASNQPQTIPISCGLADPSLELSLNADFVGTSRWERLYFSLNQRNGIVCIFW